MFAANYFNEISSGSKGGGKGAMLLKLVIKKMAAIRGALYFMFLAPTPDHPGSDAGNAHSGSFPGAVVPPSSC